MLRVLFLLACLFISQGVAAASNIAETKHNLSTSGPGQVKSSTESRLCIFCHTPHRGSPKSPMWNRPTTDFTNYQSSTTDAKASKSDGSSVLCLSCHDGTIALGDMLASRGQGRRPSDMRTKFIKGRSNLNNNLSDDHPVAILYDTELTSADPDLVDPKDVDLPMRDSELQCTTCHDPHSDATPPFLHKSTLNGELCTTCHLSSGTDWDWESSSHASSVVSPRGANPWPDRKPEWRGQNVKENACMNCHALHNAATPARLMSDREEKTCFRCHDSTVARWNIQADKQKFFRHPVDQTPSIGHDTARTEDPLRMQLHVECEDCHNPHASQSGPPLISFNPLNPMDGNHSTPPFINGSLLGVTGVGTNGLVKPEAEYEYEVCFKCHGLTAKNACDNHRCSTATSYNMVRQDGTYNLRDKFDPGNPALTSYHPVVANNPANDSQNLSLRKDIPMYETDSLIYCSDCHNSDTSPAASGIEGGGPHGSRYEGILALPYDLKPISNFSGGADNLCFKCHDSGRLYSNNPSLHRKHVIEENTSCVNCHDPHGSTVYPHLINFLTSVIYFGEVREITGAGTYTQPTWVENGPNGGTCYLNCHGVEHDGLSYPESAFDSLR